MKSKNLIIFAVLAVVVVIAWFMFSGGGIQERSNGSQDGDVQNTELTPTEGNDVVVEEVPNALKGELKISSDKRRGNYMLLMENSDRIIYLNTSRDYSSLVGKNVTVEIEGTLDDFRLVDIKTR